MISRNVTLLVLLLGLALPALAQEGNEADGSSFKTASGDVSERLEKAILELDTLRAEIMDEKLPLSQSLNELKSQQLELQSELQTVSRTLDRRNLDLTTLQEDINRRKAEISYLSNLLGEYINNLKSGMHIAERQRYRDEIKEVDLAMDNQNLTDQQIFEVQAKILDMSLGRLDDLLGGTRFEGSAVVSEGRGVENGTFVVIGPYVLFRSEDGGDVGIAETRLGGSLEPAQMPFPEEEDFLAAGALVQTGAGEMPLDPTLGNALKVAAATDESLVEHVKKGGVVMIPIFAMASLALLVAIIKWIGLTATRRPSKKQVAGLLAAIGNHDEARAKEAASEMKGPAGRMLHAGVEHIQEPKELIEEVMYESVLSTRLRLQRMLPFIAICAASAPLLGLLGTVTGIINTFKMITVHGSGDVKVLSGGISEALITTKFGLIVAIPSLILHAFLARKARGILDHMEKCGVALVNQIAKTPFGEETIRDPQPVDREAVRMEVKKALDEFLVPMLREHREELRPRVATTAGAGVPSKGDNESKWVDLVPGAGTADP